jgi:hypothetical protein
VKDAKFIAAFVVLGLVVAWFCSAPLRHPRVVDAPAEQTSRQQEVPHAQIYAEGTVETAPGFNSTAPALFLIARPAAGGMPVAVKRLPHPVFPVTFSLSPADSMTGGDFHKGDLAIIARLDADGSAGPKQPGDVETSVVVKDGGARSVHLLLDGKSPSQK